MRAKGKASVRVADILNRMQVEEPVNSNDVKFACNSLIVIITSDLAILFSYKMILYPFFTILNGVCSISGGKA